MARLFLGAAVVSLALLAGSLVAGQVLRLPLPGQGGGLLLSDIAVGLVLAVTYGALLAKQVSPSPVATRLFLLITPFLLWAAFGLVVSGVSLPVSALVVGLAYWIRLAAYLLLIPALVLLFQEPRLRRSALYSVISVACSLLLIGFLQLLFLPQLTQLPGWLTGWDPHVFRLVSTWLDPNFMGLGLLLLGLLSMATLQRSVSRIGMGVVSAAAIVLTGSRSSLLALVGVVLLAAALAGKRYVAGAIVLVLGVVLGGFLVLGNRALSLFSSDPTVALRVESLQAAWRISEQHPWLGVGYNVYQFYTGNASFFIHSRAGTDNSVLTLVATTGLIGTLLFLLPWAYSLHLLWRQWLQKRTVVVGAALACMVAVAVHSQFINSWLYGHSLIILAIGIALALSEPYAV